MTWTGFEKGMGAHRKWLEDEIAQREECIRTGKRRSDISETPEKLVQYAAELSGMKLVLANVKSQYLPKTVNRSIDEYGFEELEIRCVGPNAGHKTIIDYTSTNKKVDIGFISSSNGHGLGGSDYIRNKADVDKHIGHIAQTVWLTAEEKEACIFFLQEIASRAEEPDVKPKVPAPRISGDTSMGWGMPE